MAVGAKGPKAASAAAPMPSRKRPRALDVKRDEAGTGTKGGGAAAPARHAASPGRSALAVKRPTALAEGCEINFSKNKKGGGGVAVRCGKEPRKRARVLADLK